MKRATCINLRKRFGHEYRITHDEAYKAEATEFRTQEEPWLQQIPCDKGHIDAYGGEFLEACTNTRGGTAVKLMRLPFIDRGRSMDGDDGVNAVFHVDHFDEVAAIMRPKRRRRLSPEARAAAVERLRKYKFTARKPLSDEQGRVQTENATSEPS